VWYEEALARRMAARQMAREACWSEALAVGSHSFVTQACQAHVTRREFAVSEVPDGMDGAWSVREESCSYNAISTPKKAF